MPELGGVPIGYDAKGGDEAHLHTMTYDNQPPFFVLQPITYVGVV